MAADSIYPLLMGLLLRGFNFDSSYRLATKIIGVTACKPIWLRVARGQVLWIARALTTDARVRLLRLACTKIKLDISRLMLHYKSISPHLVLYSTFEDSDAFARFNWRVQMDAVFGNPRGSPYARAASV